MYKGKHVRKRGRYEAPRKRSNDVVKAVVVTAVATSAIFCMVGLSSVGDDSNTTQHQPTQEEVAVITEMPVVASSDLDCVLLGNRDSERQSISKVANQPKETPVLVIEGVPNGMIVDTEQLAEEQLAQERQYYYDITDEDVQMLYRLVWLEGGTESYECQQAICSVALNGWMSGEWGETLQDAVYAPNRFSVSSQIAYTEPYVCADKGYQQCKEFIDRWDSVIDAVDYVVYNGPTIPTNVMYFRTGHYHSWAHDWKKIDHTYFSY